MMRWLLTSRSADCTWRLPLLQFLLLIALMLFILATFIVLSNQQPEKPTVDLPGAQQPADVLPQAMYRSLDALPASNQVSRLAQRPADLAVSVIRNRPIEAAAADQPPSSFQPMAAPNAFKGTVTLSGGVRYFNGQTNQRGLTMPFLPLAFLAGERINVVMDFTAEPSSIIITLKDMTLTISGVVGQTHYETWLIVPEWERTIDWNGDRVLPTLTMNVHAISRANPLVQTDIAIPGLDIGGSVYDILIMQIA